MDTVEQHPRGARAGQNNPRGAPREPHLGPSPNVEVEHDLAGHWPLDRVSVEEPGRRCGCVIDTLGESPKVGPVVEAELVMELTTAQWRHDSPPSARGREVLALMAQGRSKVGGVHVVG